MRLYTLSMLYRMKRLTITLILLGSVLTLWAQETSQPLEVFISNKYPKQGETIHIQIKSSFPIRQCFGRIGKKEIRFVQIGKKSRDKKNSFRAFVGFDILSRSEKKTLLLALWTEQGKVLYKTEDIFLQNRYKKAKILKTARTKNSRDTFFRKKFIAFKNEVEGRIDQDIGGVEEQVNDLTLIQQSKRKKGQQETAFFHQQYRIDSPMEYWNGPFIQPVYPDKYYRISEFGKYRKFRYRGRTRKGYHRGLDIAQPTGTPIYATNHGIVVIADRFRYRGNSVVIHHGSGIHSVHYHLSRIVIKSGFFVRKGQLIGYIGSTGVSTGPHLHWEIRVQGVSVDTEYWRNLF